MPIARTTSGLCPQPRSQDRQACTGPCSVRLGLLGETEPTLARPHPCGAKAGGHPREKMDGQELQDVIRSSLPGEINSLNGDLETLGFITYTKAASHSSCKNHSRY